MEDEVGSSTRRGAWTRAIGTGLSLAVTCVLGAGCGADGGEEVTTPGFETSTASEETEPFELAQPSTTAGPTTAPSGGFGGPAVTDGDGEEEPEPGPTTTTTAPPSEPVLPPADDISSVCGLPFALSSYATLLQNAEVDAEEAVDGMRTNLERYVEVADDQVRAAVETIAAESGRLLDEVEASGYDRELSRFQDLIDDQAAAEEIGTLLAAIDEVVFWERRNCDGEGD